MPRTEAGGRLRRAGDAVRSYWVVLALAIPLVAIAVAAAILIWPLDNNEGAYPTKAYLKYATPSSLTPLLNDDAAAGDQVFLNEVHLIPAATDEAFLARGARGKYVLVIAEGKPVSIDDPTVANVQGVVRTLPSKAKLTREWKLTKKELSLIAGEEYYIDAQRIHVNAKSND